MRKLSRLMNKPLLSLLVVIALASPVRSAVVVSGGGAAWVAPMTGVFAAVGSERVAALGLPSLTALSTLDSHGRYIFADSPKVLDLLAENLKFYGTLESFAALPTDDKLIMLRAAAKGAEIQAAAIADKAISETKSQPLHIGSVDKISEQLAPAEGICLYLDVLRREEILQMRAKVMSFKKNWSKKLEDFSKDLPGKIAADAFDSSNILVKEEYGWVAADESPYPIKEGLGKFYSRRIMALWKAPMGPWVSQEAALLDKALDRPEVKAAVEADGQSAWNLQARLQLTPPYSDGAYQKVMGPAIEAFEKNALKGSPVAARHILAVEEHYTAAHSVFMPYPTRLRFLAAVRNGVDGIPSWKRFQEIERATYRRVHKAATIAAGIMIVGFILMFSPGGFGFAAWSTAVRIGVASLTYLAPIIVYTRNILLSNRMEGERAYSRVAQALRREFPDD